MKNHSDIKQVNANSDSWHRTITANLMRYARNGTLFYWSSFFILILFEFCIGGQLSVMLSKENYSIYISVLNTLPFYNVLTNTGISYGIVYIISYNKALGYNLFRQALRLQFIWYLIIVALHVAAFLLFPNTYFITLLITAIISYTYAYKLNITSYFLANGSYSKAAVSNMLQKSMLLVAFTLIHYANYYRFINGHFTIAYPTVELAVIFFYFIAFPKTNYHALTAPKVNYTKRLLRYGKYAMLNNALNVLYYTIVAIIIRYSLLETHLQIILGLCIVFFRYTAAAVAPVFSTMIPQLTLIKNDSLRVKALYQKYLLITCVLGVAMLLTCRFLFGFFIDHFYASSYHDLPDFFNFFSYIIPLLFPTSLNGSTLAALGKIKYTTTVEVLCTAILLLFAGYNALWPVVDYHLFFLPCAYSFVRKIPGAQLWRIQNHKTDLINWNWEN